MATFWSGSGGVPKRPKQCGTAIPTISASVIAAHSPMKLPASNGAEP